MKITPLHLAVVHHNISAVQLLLQHHCDTTIVGSMFYGDKVLNGTPFRFALDIGLVQIALLIKDSGHNLAMEDYIWNCELDVSRPEEYLPRCLHLNRVLLDWLKEEFETEASLLRMCRSVIRLSMALYLGQLQESMDYSGVLPLPGRLLNFVVFPEFVWHLQ